MSEGWTQERVDRASRMWLGGKSAGEISKALGGISRSGVIGKMYRLGHTRIGVSNPTRLARERKPAPRVKTVTPAVPALKSQPLPREDDAPGTATIHTLSAHMCKWPIGDPKADNFTYCGGAKSPDGPYCKGHAARAYSTPKPAVRRRA